MNNIKIIIAQINHYNSYEDFYSGAHKYVDVTYSRLAERLTKYLSEQNATNYNVVDVYYFEDLEDEIRKNKDSQIVIFSNFPANNTYKRYKLLEKDNEFGYIADAYNKTLEKYKTILQDNSNIKLHIITGASESLISNHEIVSINKNIVVKRKAEWVNFTIKDYETYIKDSISE